MKPVGLFLSFQVAIGEREHLDIEAHNNFDLGGAVPDPLILGQDDQALVAAELEPFGVGRFLVAAAEDLEMSSAQPSVRAERVGACRPRLLSTKNSGCGREGDKQDVLDILDPPRRSLP